MFLDQLIQCSIARHNGVKVHTFISYTTAAAHTKIGGIETVAQRGVDCHLLTFLHRLHRIPIAVAGIVINAHLLSREAFIHFQYLELGICIRQRIVADISFFGEVFGNRIR